MRGFWITVTFWLTNVAIAFAQDPAADSRATEFRAMQGPARESIPGAALLMAAYSLVWIFIFVFVVRIALHFKTTAKRLDVLQAAIDKKSASSENKG